MKRPLALAIPAIVIAIPVPLLIAVATTEAAVIIERPQVHLDSETNPSHCQVEFGRHSRTIFDKRRKVVCLLRIQDESLLKVFNRLAKLKIERRKSENISDSEIAEYQKRYDEAFKAITLSLKCPPDSAPRLALSYGGIECRIEKPFIQSACPAGFQLRSLAIHAEEDECRKGRHVAPEKAKK